MLLCFKRHSSQVTPAPVQPSQSFSELCTEFKENLHRYDAAQQKAKRNEILLSSRPIQTNGTLLQQIELNLELCRLHRLIGLYDHAEIYAYNALNARSYITSPLTPNLCRLIGEIYEAKVRVKLENPLSLKCNLNMEELETTASKAFEHFTAISHHNSAAEIRLLLVNYLVEKPSLESMKTAQTLLKTIHQSVKDGVTKHSEQYWALKATVQQYVGNESGRQQCLDQLARIHEFDKNGSSSRSRPPL